MVNQEFVLGFFFFFQAEDGIRDYKVTGVQTCALPIWFWGRPWPGQWALDLLQAARLCRETFGAASVSVDARNPFGWSCLLAGAAAPEILGSGRVRIPWPSLQEIIRARGDKALADVPGLLERLDVPQLRALWPEGNVEVKP